MDKNESAGKDLPGYPHYPAQEDITQPSNNTGRVNMEEQQDKPVVAGTDNDANNRFGKLDNTDNDGDPLNEETDNAGTDLDVPGSEDDDANEEIGEEDEENNYYSDSNQEQ